MCRTTPRDGWQTEKNRSKIFLKEELVAVPLELIDVLLHKAHAKLMCPTVDAEEVGLILKILNKISFLFVCSFGTN